MCIIVDVVSVEVVVVMFIILSFELGTSLTGWRMTFSGSWK